MIPGEERKGTDGAVPANRPGRFVLQPARQPCQLARSGTQSGQPGVPSRPSTQLARPLPAGPCQLAQRRVLNRGSSPGRAARLAPRSARQSRPIGEADFQEQQQCRFCSFLCFIAPFHVLFVAFDCYCTMGFFSALQSPVGSRVTRWALSSWKLGTFMISFLEHKSQHTHVLACISRETPTTHVIFYTVTSYFTRKRGRPWIISTTTLVFVISPSEVDLKI